MASENGKLDMIPVNLIRENPVALRAVNKKSEKYIGLVDSIKQKGILNPIVVREMIDPETKKTFYAVIDGLHRYTASLDAGLKEIPCYIKDLQESEILEAQIIANVHKVETRAAEYAKQLQRILVQNPLLTGSELAAKLGKSPTWLSQILNLNRIKDQKIQELINEGKIKLSNAFFLTKLPEEEMPNFVDRAMTQSPAEFIPTVNQRAKEIKDAKRKGKDVAPEEFVAVPHLRKLKEVKEEKESYKVGTALIQQLNLTTPMDAWKIAVDWMLQVDPKSVEIRKAQDEERKRQKEEEKVKKQQERTAQRAKEAAERAAAIVSGT